MHLTEVEEVRKVFDSIDTDKSGLIEDRELREALIKAGKKPSNEQIKGVLDKYAENAEKGLTFEEFRKVIADWEDIIANISRP